MKLKISLISAKKVILPKSFNHITQAWIYNLLDTIPAQWLHEKGFQLKKRTFKLFVFSSIIEKGEFLKKEKLFIFPQQISLYLSTPVNWIIEQIAKNVTIRDETRLGENRLRISSVEIIKDQVIKEKKIRINALTPIEVHSTLFRGDGAKKTYYYSPRESEFSQLINENLKKKWSALYKKECPYNMKIEPVKMEHCRERIRSFRDFIVKGWTGHFRLEGEPEFLQFGLTAGLGSRNSGGFGFIEIVG